MNKTAITLWLAEISSLCTSALAGLAALPFEQGDLSLIIPPAWKPVLFKWSLTATVILRLLIAAINLVTRILTKKQLANLTELSKAPLIAIAAFATFGLAGCQTITITARLAYGNSAVAYDGKHIAVEADARELLGFAK